jgi:mRNA interferase MazF
MKRTPKQLEIWWVDLEPTRGAETQKQRPCVVLQSDVLNPHSATTVIAPLLPGLKPWPFVVNITPSKQNGIDQERHVNLKQIRAVSLERFSNRQGILESRYLPAIQDALRMVFGI